MLIFSKIYQCLKNVFLQRRQDSGLGDQEEDSAIKLGDSKTISKCSYCTRF